MIPRTNPGKKVQDLTEYIPGSQQVIQQVAGLPQRTEEGLDLMNGSFVIAEENPNRVNLIQAINESSRPILNTGVLGKTPSNPGSQAGQNVADRNLFDLGLLDPVKKVANVVEDKVEELKEDVDNVVEDVKSYVEDDEDDEEDDQDNEYDQEDQDDQDDQDDYYNNEDSDDYGNNDEDDDEDQDEDEDGEYGESSQQGDSNPEEGEAKGLLGNEAREISILGKAAKPREDEVAADEEIFKLQIDSPTKDERGLLLDKKEQPVETKGKAKTTAGGKKVKPKAKPKKTRKEIESENLKKKLKDDEAEVRKAIQQRKRVRFFAYTTYLVIIAIVAAFALTTLIEKHKIYASSGASFDITLENCTLLITDHTSDVSNDVYLKYHVPRNLQVDKGSEIITSSSGNTQTLYIKNGFSERYCLVELFVKSSAQLGSLKIACPGCNITQDNSFQLQVTGALDISGSVINANFRNIKVGSISYVAESGYLQLSNIDTTSTANTITMSYEGDIIIQSTSDFFIKASSPNQAFCFNAPGIYVATPTTTYNCAISGDTSTDTLLGNTACQMEASLCASSSCSAAVASPKYTVTANTSNVYANIIPSVGTPTVTTGTTTKGQVYDAGLSFSPTALAAVTGFDTIIDDQSKGNPFILLEIGNFGSRSSRSTKWVLSSTPSYSYMRPWWIGTMSATVLNGYTERVKGFMLPGTCPFVPQYTTENLLAIQTLMASKINHESTLITFVNDETMAYPPATPQANSGVFYYAPRGNPFDKWLSLTRLQNGNIVLQNNDYTSKGEILAAIILSLIIAAYVAITMIQLTIIAINMMYHKLVNFANHMESYTKLEQPKEVQKAREEGNKDANKNKKKVVQTKNTLFNILKNSPSPSAFIDYLSLILYRQFSSSVAQFYNLLFREVNTLPGADPELDPAHDMIKGAEAKIFYEKFCFMNHLNEEKLTDKPNLALLKQYGFTITTREDLMTEVFTRINIKNYDNFLISPLNDYENMNSLEIYLKENAEITEFQEDQIEVDTFIRIYYGFCDYNRLPRVTLSPSVMKEKFGVNSSVVPQQFIVRREDMGAEQDEEEEGSKDSANALFRALIKCKNRIRPPVKKVYNLDTSKLDNHFNLIMNTTQDMTPKQLSSATRELILYPRWWLWDWITVLFHLLVGAVITLPLVGLTILNESQYEPWSLKEPTKLILIEDLIRDPRDLIYNLYHSFTWNIIIMIIVSVLWVLSFIDLLLYYSVMEFPQDKSFKKSEEKGETFWQKVSRILEWVLVLFALACYFGYIGLFLTWLLLGAFINPNSFLPFASGAVTFVTFVSTKYKTFKDLSAKGTKAVMDYLKEVFGGFINKLMGKLTQNLDKAADSLTDKGKALLESDTFKTATGKLAETGIVDAATIAEYTRKIKQIDGKVALSGAIAVMDDPSVVLKEINSLALALKEKAIEKVKEECGKRGIPPSLVEFVIAASLKDNKKMKDTLKQVIVECNQHIGMPESSIEIIIEMLFPQSLNKDEMVMFITTKIVQIIFDNFGLNNIEGLTPEILINAFNNFKNLQDLEITAFVKGLKGLLAYVQKSCGIKEMDFFLPTLDIISVIGQKGGDYWRIKNPALNLLTNAVSYISGDNSEKNMNMVKNFVKFLSVVSSSYETPTDFITGQPLNNSDVLGIINDMFSSLGLDKLCEKAGNGKLDKKFAGNLVYLVIAFTRQETHDLPKELIRDLEKTLELKALGKNEILSFLFNLVNVIFNTPRQFHQRLQQNISSFALEEDLQNFLKIVTCYSLDDFKTQYSSISVENNKYFIDLAGALKIQPTELLGLIDVIYNKANSRNTDIFLTAILKRMNLKSDKLETAKPLMNLFLSEDEAAILETVKTLDLKCGQFLLIAKGILNPSFIPESQFKEVGITDPDLLKEKDTIWNSSPENYEYWKGQLRTNIQTYLTTLEAEANQTGSATSANQQKNAKAQEEDRKAADQKEQDSSKKRAEVNLVKLYLNDWTTYSFSKKNVTSLIAVLDNPTNKLKEKLTKTEKGSSYNGLDFLTTILTAKELELNKNKRYARLDKEKESTISVLSEYLSVNPDTLKNCLQIFVIDDPKVVLKSFLDFFPGEKNYHGELQKIFTYTFKQSSIIQNQTEFVTHKLPNCVEVLGDKTLSLPQGLFKKIFFGASKGQMSISEVLELANLAIRKFIKDNKIQQILLEVCYKAGLFAKGLLSKEDIAKSFNVQDERILKLFDVLMQSDMKSRLTVATEFFKEDHPIKKALAVFGLFTRQTFKIRHPTSEAGKFKEESIKQYLASQFNVYPEVFELFDIAFERNISNFIQKALPLVRRVNEVSFVDINLLESLFALSLGERFNTGYLANRLEMSSDVIDFFVTITRLTTGSTREKELKALPDSIPTQKILTKLKVKSKELTALTKLVFNLFEADDASVNEILKGLGLKKTVGKNEVKEAIDVDLFKGLVSVNAYIDPSKNMFVNRKNLALKRSETSNFFNTLGLSSTYDFALIISRIAAGDYLVMREFRQQLDWAFPNNGSKSDVAIRNLTMGLCGIMNSVIEVPLKLNEEVDSFIKTFYLKEKDFKEAEYKLQGKNKNQVLPNNSLAYAIYLTYQTLDIDPTWTQSFLLNQEIFHIIKSKLPDLKNEFVLTVILNFICMSEYARDYLALYEWMKYSYEFAGKNPMEIGEFNELFYKGDMDLDAFFEKKILFDYEKTIEMANKLGLFQDETWRKFFGKLETYNSAVNQTFLYLLTLDEKDNSKKKAYLAQVSKDIALSPAEFLPKLANVLNGNGTNKVGEMTRNVVVKCYTTIANKFNPDGQRLKGYELTNMSMLGVIKSLRNNAKTKMTYNQTLYNLHQFVMNIERKLFLEDCFFKMSKFKTMKFIGIALGIQVNNIVEWCLPPSLFSFDYVSKLNTAKNVQTIKDIRVQQITRAFQTLPIGDLGAAPGSLSIYQEVNADLLKMGDWDFIEVVLELNNHYLGDPQTDTFKHPEDLDEKDEGIFEEGETENQKVFISREIVSLLYTGKVVPPKKAHEEEKDDIPKQNMNMSKAAIMKMRKEQRASKEDAKTTEIKKATVDVKTGLGYQSLERKSEEFEEILTDANMDLLQGIIKGDPSILLRGQHVINKGDEQNTKAKLYMALLGLQAFKKSSGTDRKQFKEYVNILAAYMESNIAKLEELLTFFITKKPNLNECVSALELQESIVDLLLMKVKEAANTSKASEEEENEDEESDKFSIIKTIQDTLNIDKSDLESFSMIRNIYQFKLKTGWLKLIKRMIKEVPQGNAGTQYTQAYHPLLSLAKSINFRKMIKELDSLEIADILKYLKVDKKYKGDVFSMLFEEIIMMDKAPIPADQAKKLSDRELQLQAEQEEKNKKQKEFLLKAYHVVQSIINQDFKQLFGMLLLTNGDKIDFKTLNKKPDAGTKKDLPEETKENNVQNKASSESQEEFLIEILNLLGVQTKIPTVKEGIKLLKVFLTMASSNLTMFKTKENYKDVLAKIIKEISETKLISFTGLKLDAGQEKKIANLQRQVGELLLGVLSWDIEVVLKSFITEETLEEAYLLYHIYGCLKLNRVLSLGDDGIAQAQRHIQVLLSVVFKAISSKSIADAMFQQDGSFDTLMNDEFGFGTNEEKITLMKKKVEELLSNTLPTGTTGAKIDTKSLLEHVTGAFKNKSEDELNLSDFYQGISSIFTSICDGTILVKLLNTYIQDDALKAVIKSIIDFILQIIEKFFSPNGKNKNYEDIINAFNVTAQALKDLAQKQSANQTLTILLDNVPNVMKIYLTLESGGTKDLGAVEVQVLSIIKGIINNAASPDRQELLYNLLSIVLGVNMNTFNEKTAGNKLKFDVGAGERMQIFFTKIMPAIFPGLSSYFEEDDFRMIYDLIIKLKTDFVINYKDPQKQREIVIQIAKLVENFGGCDAEMVKSIVAFLEGNFEDTKYLVRKVVPQEISDDNVDKMLSYVCEVKNVLNIDFASKLALPSSKDSSKNKEAQKMDPDTWATMLKKIKEGTASPKDLFKLVDEEGDKSGTISEKEFETLAGRLGVKLSKHRIKEIFAKVKGNKAKGGVENELNEKEFELALDYLEGKNLNQALQLLGITPEILTAILIRLIILLILIFAFIFIGIKAFAIGGTFGAIINSAFPAAGGLGLGKQSDSDKEKLNNQNIVQASETGMEITASEQI